MIGYSECVETFGKKWMCDGCMRGFALLKDLPKEAMTQILHTILG